jgi:hypothetical protein
MATICRWQYSRRINARPPDDAMTALSGEGELAGSVGKDTERKETQDNSNTALND